MKDNKVSVMFPVNYLGIGGAERQLIELVKGIDKERFSPIIVTLYPGGPLDSEIKRVPNAELISLNRKSKYDFSIINRMFSLLRQKRIDIIQPFLTPATFFGIFPAMLARIPVKIVTERCGVRNNTPRGYKTYLMMEDIFTRFADWVVPNSDSGKNLLLRRGIKPDKIKIIYNGINFDRLITDEAKITQIKSQMNLTSENKVVGITASLTPAKDHITFLRAAKIIRQTIPQTRFAILGDGPLRQDLEKLVKEMSLESCVTFLGAQHEVGSYVSVFDIFCLSSIDHEGCSNATLEAMSLGKPVVVTDLGGNREVVTQGETGFLVPVRNPENLAESVMNYLNYPDLAQKIGINAKKSVLTKFGLSRMIKEYEQLYEEAVEQKRKFIHRSGN